MATLANISSKYQDLFNSMVIKPSVKARAITAAQKIITGKKQYNNISTKLNPKIPWYFIGIIHMMEADCSFSKHLHNGDSLKKRTWQVPSGRPIAEPWNGFPTGYTFIESAMDALTMKGYHIQMSWTLELMLYRLEKYNGFGYVRRGIATPYLWAGTNHYTKGKFLSDGEFSKNAVSDQIGTAILIRYLTDKTLGIV